MNTLQHYKSDFVELLLASEALRFGEFTTKSGRQTPYFINTGAFNDGQRIAELGRLYAEHIVALGLDNVDILFGPAYKGISLCVSVAQALFLNHNISLGYCFDRKEQKQHGDKGGYVGKQVTPGSRVLLVEDVVTAGTTFKKMIPELRSSLQASISDAVIAVDRCEKGDSNKSAVSQIESELEIKIHPIVTIHEIISYLESNRSGILTADLRSNIRAYLDQYGV
ncbi:MAG: orotate phosphoribosyltransferase [Bdellovibrionales bacterium]|nr:orotate phosphoribosyltransferase [Bdellovibrionales bacterium]